MTMPPVMILCGGRGTRLREVTELLPKPMVPIGEQPIVWHIMRTYAAFGVRRFILCLGYKRECFVDYFLNFRARHLRRDADPRQPGEDPLPRQRPEEEWEVTLTDTGIETMTGGRVLRAARYLAPEDREFFLTYGDGLSDLDIGALLAAHRRSGKLLTVAAVHPEGRFGELQFDGETVESFARNPPASPATSTGGFMAVNREFLDRYLPEGCDDDFFERRPMREAVRDRTMGAFPHDGFWQCMDTPREYQLLNQLWESGHAPWTRYWK